MNVSGARNGHFSFIYLRSRVHRTEGRLVSDSVSIRRIALFDVRFEVRGDSTGVWAHSDLPESWDAQQFVLIKDEVLHVVRDVAVIVPCVPEETRDQGDFGELQNKREALIKTGGKIEFVRVCDLRSLKDLKPIELGDGTEIVHLRSRSRRGSWNLQRILFHPRISHLGTVRT